MKKIIFSILLVLILVIIAVDYFSPVVLAGSASCESGECSCTCFGPDECTCISGGGSCSCSCIGGGASSCSTGKHPEELP